jgi:hypothetical protein
MPGESIEVGPKLRELGLPRQNDGRRSNENGRRETPDDVLVAVCRIVLEVMHSVLNVHPLPILRSVPLILQEHIEGDIENGVHFARIRSRLELVMLDENPNNGGHGKQVFGKERLEHIDDVHMRRLQSDLLMSFPQRRRLIVLSFVPFATRQCHFP